MSQSVIAFLPHDQAVIARLQTVGKPVGFAAAPTGALEAVQAKTGPDYYIVFPLNSARDGSLGDPFTQGDISYQVTCVGRSAAGVRWLVDKAEDALRSVTVSGRSIIQFVPEDGGQVRVDFDVDPPVFLATPRYRFLTVPT